MLESKTQAGYYLLKIKFNQKGFEKKFYIMPEIQNEFWGKLEYLRKGIELKSLEKNKLIIFQMWILVTFSVIQICWFPEAFFFLLFCPTMDPTFSPPFKRSSYFLPFSLLLTFWLCLPRIDFILDF